jgi:methyl-accepting chemotaxis protein
MALNTETLLIIFVAFTGVSVLLQACVLLAIYLSLRKTAKSAMDASEDLKTTVLPMVHSTKELVDRITPQVITISEGLAELTQTLKKESRGVSFSASEIMERVNRQTQRLDGMLTNGLDAVERAGEVVETAVAAPIRQVNGIMAAIKAMIETYRSDAPHRKPVYPNSDTGPIDPEI